MTSHDSEHVSRVIALAKYIAEKEGADVEVVVKAAELHDIARNEKNHALKGAEIARRMFTDSEFAEKVAHCIESHSFSSGIKPKTLEAKILSDADKIDAMGAIGIARAFMYSGERGRGIEDTIKHFEDKLLKLITQIHTETAMKIAMDRHNFMLEFYEKLKEELKFISSLKSQ
ncbi:MAG: phosphohydrolase [Archaeoglobus sp.]|nr:MAG: phosphohydrolase [Archaeoglobus sp.]